MRVAEVASVHDDLGKRCSDNVAFGVLAALRKTARTSGISAVFLIGGLLATRGFRGARDADAENLQITAKTANPSAPVVNRGADRHCEPTGPRFARPEDRLHEAIWRG